MKSYKIFAASIALATGLATAATPARAQAAAAAAATAEKVTSPIITRVITVFTPKARPEGSTWLKAEVIHADAVIIIVREQANERMIHTFTFAPELKDKMQAILDKGGLQYGDKVSILAMPGQTVALRIHGKPSKPL
ncbi:MAG TPA: hypothetical protein VJO53_02485 [Candidatus Acidoferrales bacterium]|nr:hypothetical protein [Candidatus Acidoferrales bacterium]